MKVFYNTCVADPWIQVAQKLQREHGWEPVYWNGYHDDGSRTSVPEAFPDIIYQGYHEGWKGIFPPEIESRYAEGALDIDELNELSRYELQAIRMMDRMDPDRASFNFMERQRHFRNLLRYWSGCINWLKPDAVISAVVPHRVFDYALYLLCKNRGIPYLCFRESAFPGRNIPVTDIFGIGDILDDSYRKFRESSESAEELRKRLPTGILERMDKVKQDYSTAEPEYMKRNLTSHKKTAGVVGLSKKFIKDISESGDLYLGQHGVIKQGMSYLKEAGVPPEKSKLSVAKYAALKVKNNRYKKGLKAHYESLVTAPDWDQPFVILNLHYQPEMTSNPSGDVFTDQTLAVDVLSRHLPDGWHIYVKEHRTQFYSHREGHTGRIAGFYDDLVRFPKVRLLPLDTDPFTCIRNSKAVCTITGTTGWEGMVMGKPVIVFGLAWYEKNRNVHRVTNEESASEIATFLSGFKPDERDVLAYLCAFWEQSMHAYHYPALKQKLEMDEDMCVTNISSALIKMLNNARS